MPAFNTNTYISPFTWRYGTEKMRLIFSEQHKYELWRKVWISLAKVQNKAGLVSNEELADLEKFAASIDIEEILKIEKETKHDVVAAIKEYAQKAQVGGGKIHLGLTSMDVVDNTEAMRNKEALDLVEQNVKELLKLFAEKIEQYASTVCLGYTHLQPAEPTTVGYRFAFYAQDLLTDLALLQFIKQMPTGKGIKGATGTQASFKALLEEKGINPENLETEVMQMLDVRPVDISTQVYSRKIDYLVLTFLASIASSVAKFAADLRILQSPTIGEWSEPFGEKQVGSSAMPFKKNPINSEKICSLARMVATMPQVAIENATHSYLERTLDDSANRRIVTPEAFLAVDEILETAKKLVSGIIINTQRIAFNLSQYAPFIASEGILMQAVKKGADRQNMHEVLRDCAMKAWAQVAEGKPNPMENLLKENEEIKKYVSVEEIEKQLDVTSHIGTAPERALKIVAQVHAL
ncbi:MAG TPA: adenylosuccinate lyase [Patescibacteria group bacterium]